MLAKGGGGGKKRRRRGGATKADGREMPPPPPLTTSLSSAGFIDRARKSFLPRRCDTHLQDEPLGGRGVVTRSEGRNEVKRSARWCRRRARRDAAAAEGI